MKFTIAAVLFLSVSAAAGEWVYVRPEAGLGFTDNVYQDDTTKKSDAFIWLQALAKYGLTDGDLVGKLNLTHFTKESANDSASYYLKYITPLAAPKTDLSIVVGGFSYFKTDVGSTEEAFTNAYISAYVTKTFRANAVFEYNLEPGVKFSSYPQLANRFDTSAFFRADGYWAVSRETEVNPYSELGFIFSNQGYYSRSYFDLGCSVTQVIDTQYKVNGDLFLRTSSYPNRRVSDILLNPNRAGRVTSRSIDTNEAINLTQISAALIRTDGQQDLSVGFSYARETSLSQLTGYKEMQATASAKWNF
jgi:hypothetical protein